MYKIPPILTPKEIMSKALKRVDKVKVTARDRTKRQKKMAQAKVKTGANTINRTLRRYVKSFPSFDNIPPFYNELFDVSVGIDDLKKSLGALDWCRKKISSIAGETVSKIDWSEGGQDANNLKKAAFGRFSSLLNQIKGDLEFLEGARHKLKKAPTIDAQKPTIVFAGAPNVGKSLLVTRISSAKPEIASYPFTTKGISIGHFEIQGEIFQVIDTPGLLDRKMEERNEMEKKAILALRHLANIIVFIIDPSEYCGYDIKVQLGILADIKERFGNIPLIEVENKVDIQRTDSKRLKISALEGEGVEELRKILVKHLIEESERTIKLR